MVVHAFHAATLITGNADWSNARVRVSKTNFRTIQSSNVLRCCCCLLRRLLSFVSHDQAHSEDQMNVIKSQKSTWNDRLRWQQQRQLGQQKTTPPTINDHGNKQEDNKHTAMTEDNNHTAPKWTAMNVKRFISASSWIEINKLSRKLRFIDDRRTKERTNERMKKLKKKLFHSIGQLDNGMASAISAYITSATTRARVFFEGWHFFVEFRIFSFIIIIYSSLTPNYILCKVIKIIVIVRGCLL